MVKWFMLAFVVVGCASRSEVTLLRSELETTRLRVHQTQLANCAVFEIACKGSATTDEQIDLCDQVSEMCVEEAEERYKLDVGVEAPRS